MANPSEASPWAVPLSDVLVDDELVEAVRDTVASGWWSMGPVVEEFEDAFARACGSRYAISVSSGSAALHLALLAIGCGPGDEVILPSLNFVAAANAIANTGARPVFCDVAHLDNLNLDPADVEAVIGPATRAILVLHYGGHPCDMEPILELGRKHGVSVVEDAAHAIGAVLNDRQCGTFGELGCFSFFANKNLPIGEGGMVITDDDDLAAQVRLLRSHGMTTLTWARHRGHAHTYDVVAQGFNYRLDELRAAIGLVQLSRLRDANHARGHVAEYYRGALHRKMGLTIPFEPDTADVVSSHHLSVVIVPDGMQQAVREHMASARIQTSIHYPPIHQFSIYAKLARRSLPITESAGRRLITLPLFPHMSLDQAELVSGTLLEAVAHAP